jgi:hypothetical protein
VGPTLDGRSKPDIVAPASLTSFSTPLVAGSAAILAQGGSRGDGGAGTAAAATDVRVSKALLLNGAEKPAGWTNTSAAPLDPRHGAGVLNVLNAYRQLRGGKHSPAVSVSIALGDAHPPPDNTNNISVRRGWDFTAISSSVTRDAVNHYFFDLSGESNRLFTFTGTLVWERQHNEIAINDLDLFLFNADSNTLVASSQSAVDNVEHLFVDGLPPGRYNLQVFKNGGVIKRVSNSETYALVFDFGLPEAVRLTNPALTNGQFRFRLSGEPSQTYVVQATADFGRWFSIFTNSTSGQGFFDFAESQIGSGGRRFYRALLRP